MWSCFRELCGRVSGSYVVVFQGAMWSCFRELCGRVSGSYVVVFQGAMGSVCTPHGQQERAHVAGDPTSPQRHRHLPVKVAE